MTRRTLVVVVAVVVGALAVGDALAEIVHLHDGTSINADRVVRKGDGWDVYDVHGKVTHVLADRVRSIELSPKGDPNDVAMGKLISLRRSVEALGDLKVVIDRFEKFVEQHKNTPAGKEAAKDLAEWKDRQAKGMVKVGSKWVLPEQRSELQEKALMQADAARELLKQNKLKEAEGAIEKALVDDPQNSSALYMRGLILYRQDKIPQARAAFEKVREAMPDHGPTLNNLAVVMWRQNQQMAALNTYLAAMQAMPLNKELLNNVAEALNAIPEKDRNNAIPQKVYKVWTEQDAQLQQTLMPLGWYRWGGTWVDKNTFDKLQKEEAAAKEKIAKMETDFAEAQAKVRTIDAQIAANTDAMNWIDNQRRHIDATGRLVVYPLPQQYYDYQRANVQLEIQRQTAVVQIDKLRAQAQAVKNLFPVPKYTGVQLAIGVEGTPAIVVAAAPTRPEKVVENGGGGAANGAEKPEAGPDAGIAAPGNLLDEVGGTPAPKKPADKPLKY